MKQKCKGRIDVLLLAVIVLSIFLNFYQLQDAGSNTYYTIAVKSMLKNFHNFFYGAFDPAGFVTVDKPPVALWVQTLSAYIFGLSDFSVLLPEALAGVISVWLMYIIVKPKFGRASALLSSLILSCTPIFVAVVRTNNVDSILILTLLIATWALMNAVEKQKISWLIGSFVLVGIAFNIKMLQAYMVLPAFYLFYLIAMKTSWKKRIAQLAIATIVLAAVSFSWAAIVDSVSKDSRPYIGSSQTNSVFELALGYNGVSRITGNQGGSESGNEAPPTNNQVTNVQEQAGTNTNGTQQGPPSMNGNNMPSPPGNGAPGQGASMQGGQLGGSSGMFGTGNPSVIRLFGKELSGQASWLLPFVLFAIIGLALQYWKTRVVTTAQKFAIFWLAWLLPMMIFFSIAKFFHQYYLSMMGPAIAALVGIGWSVLWKFYKEDDGWHSWLLPVSILTTSLFEALVLFENRSVISTGWISVPVVLGIVIPALLITMRKQKQISFYVAVVGIMSLLIFPFYWTLATILDGANSATPVAGPNSQQSGMGGGPGPMMGTNPSGGPTGYGTNQEGTAVKNTGNKDTQVDEKLITYLKKNYNGETYLLATESAMEAYPFMLHTDYAVMAMGGFSGSDPILTTAKLEKMVKSGEVKYFLVSDQGRGNQEISAWIKKNCKEVPSSEWKTSSNQNQDNQQSFNRGQNTKLYVYKG